MDNPLRILMVEDSESDAALIVRALEKEGFTINPVRVETVADLEAALKGRTWDLILSDYTLPAFNALAVLNIFKETGLDIPVIVVSGVIGEETAVALMKAGANDYIAKGAMARLAPAIRRELAEARIRKERRQAIAERRWLEDKYRKLFERAPVGIFQARTDGRLLQINPAFAQMLGFAYPHETPSSLADIGMGEPSQVFDLAGHIRERLNEQGWFRMEHRFRRKDGTKITVNLTIRGLADEDERITTMEAFVEDISERKRAETALMRSEERFRQVAENAGEWIWEVDADGVYTYASPVCEQILGYAPEELVGKLHFYDLFTEEARDSLQDMAMRAFAAGQPFHNFENSNRRRDGETVILETSGVPLWREDGRLAGYRGVDKDITGRKRAEESIRQTQHKLEAAIKASLAALTATVEIRDPYTAGHQERVMHLAEAMARGMGLTEERVESVRIAGAIHDLGKIAVPAELLSKPSKLNPLEFRMVQTHAQVGFEILAKIEFPWPLSRIVHEHHERLDGSGYPQGLKGPVTLLESRILAIADVVESMCSHRPYRPALGIEAALAEIEAGQGRLYDEAAVNACVRLFRESRFRFA